MARPRPADTGGIEGGPYMGIHSKGDKVVLRSGGPVMTVICALSNGDAISGPWLRGGWKAGDVLCKWKDERTGEEKTQAFSPEWLHTQ